MNKLVTHCPIVTFCNDGVAPTNRPDAFQIHWSNISAGVRLGSESPVIGSSLEDDDVEEIMAQKISPFLWFESEAEEAANFYVSIFKNSEILEVSRNGENGQAFVVNFKLDGQEFKALNGGPMFKFT